MSRSNLSVYELGQLAYLSHSSTLMGFRDIPQPDPVDWLQLSQAEREAWEAAVVTVLTSSQYIPERVTVAEFAVADMTS